MLPWRRHAAVRGIKARGSAAKGDVAAAALPVSGGVRLNLGQDVRQKGLQLGTDGGRVAERPQQLFGAWQGGLRGRVREEGRPAVGERRRSAAARAIAGRSKGEVLYVVVAGLRLQIGKEI